jgi:hypothetical protein
VDPLRLPFFAAIEDARTILLAGAGGGFDVFAGLPLYFGLRAAGKTVHLANLSFSDLDVSDGRRLGEALVEVTADTEGILRYFPERHLARWFREARGEDVPIYAIKRAGARPVAAAYRNLAAHLGDVDTLILVDGGTDSLMRGDEAGLGTPEEDVASIAAADALSSITDERKFLVCLGFGVDTFHGVCHAQFLEAVADLTRSGGFLGAWTLTPDMPEAALYREATEYVHRIMVERPSIVSTSILSAIEGRFGDYHANVRTKGSELFINALMSLYWCFRLPAVARRNLYLDQIRDTQTWYELHAAIHKWRVLNGPAKPWVSLPM